MAIGRAAVEEAALGGSLAPALQNEKKQKKKERR